MNKPHPSLLLKWRLIFILGTLAVVFFFSLIFRLESFWRWIVFAVYICLFVAGYLWYLPKRFKSIGFALGEKDLRLQSGVFTIRMRALPRKNAQFTDCKADLLDMIFRLNSVTITAPGGRLTIPGLSKKDAKELINATTGESAPYNDNKQPVEGENSYHRADN